MDFWRAVDILNKRKWLILLSVLVTLALTFGATRIIGSKWVATVSFAATSARAGLTETTGTITDPSMNPNTVKTQAALYTAIVKSKQVLQPAFTKAGVREGEASGITDGIKFDAKGPGIFELQVTDNNPQRAALLANEITDGFIEHYKTLYTKRAADVVKAAKEQLNEAMGREDLARKKYEDYRKQHDLIGSLPEQLQPAMFRLQSARQQRDEVVQLLSEAEARLRDRNAELADEKEYVPVLVPTGDNAYINQLRGQLGEAKAKLKILQAKYTDQHIEVQQQKALISQLDETIRTEEAKPAEKQGTRVNPRYAVLKNAVAEIKQDIAGLRAKNSALNASLSSAENEVKRYSGLDGKLAMLVSDVTQLMATRSDLNARYQSAQMALDQAERELPLSAMDRVSEFNPPINASAGRTSKLIVLAALCALLGTAGLLIAYDGLDRRLRTVREAELVLPGPVLTAIPQPVGAVTENVLPRATELQPLSLHSEAYRFLGLHLLSARGKRIRSIMVMSAKADQGSLSTVTNLGITLAQAGKRVIVVDANIRTPRLHDAFGMGNQFGLTDLLQSPDAASLESALHPTSVPNLRVITSGAPYSNPWELFRSTNLMELAGRLSDLADYVIYDTPSALAFTDAMNLAPAVDAAFLCVKALEPPSGAEQRLIEMLEDANVVVLGSVLNNVPATILESYQNYQRYYPNVLNTTPSLAPGSTTAVAVAAPSSSWMDTGSNGVSLNGNGVNGHGSNGHGANGHGSNGSSPDA